MTGDSGVFVLLGVAIALAIAALAVPFALGSFTAVIAAWLRRHRLGRLGRNGAQGQGQHFDRQHLDGHRQTHSAARRRRTDRRRAALRRVDESAGAKPEAMVGDDGSEPVPTTAGTPDSTRGAPSDDQR